MRHSIRLSFLGRPVPAKNYWRLPKRERLRLLWQLFQMGNWLGMRPITICSTLLVYFGLSHIYGLVFEEGVPTDFANFIAPAIIVACVSGTASSCVFQLTARAVGISAQMAFKLTAIFAILVAMSVLAVGFWGHWNSIILLSAMEAFLVTGFAAFAAVSVINWYHGTELDRRADDLFASFDAALTLASQPIQARLPAAKRGAVLALSVEDKQLTVWTENGSQTLRLTMREALTELDPEEGVLVHRSHWVRTDQMQECIAEDGKLALRLANGSVVPVSRRRLPQVKELMDD